MTAQTLVTIPQEVFEILLEKLDRLTEAVASVTGAGPAALSLAEAAELLGVSEKTVRREIDAGNLRRVKGRGKIRISRTEIERYLNAQ